MSGTALNQPQKKPRLNPISSNIKLNPKRAMISNMIFHCCIKVFFATCIPFEFSDIGQRVEKDQLRLIPTNPYCFGSYPVSLQNAGEHH